jgi:hypothetical protein
LAVCFDFSLEYHGECSWIDELYVDEGHRGKGIRQRATAEEETGGCASRVLPM